MLAFSPCYNRLLVVAFSLFDCVIQSIEMIISGHFWHYLLSATTGHVLDLLENLLTAILSYLEMNLGTMVNWIKKKSQTAHEKGIRREHEGNKHARNKENACEGKARPQFPSPFSLIAPARMLCSQCEGEHTRNLQKSSDTHVIST